MDPPEAQVGLMIKSHASIHNDILIRRQKNRERQRRYRARKRLEADIKKSQVPKQPAVPQIEVQLKEIPTSGINRVYCKRDWKKDARLAHMGKGMKDKLNASMQCLTGESQPLCLTSLTAVGQSVERKYHSENSLGLANSEMNKTRVGPRNWKADARNKKS